MPTPRLLVSGLALASSAGLLVAAGLTAAGLFWGVALLAAGLWRLVAQWPKAAPPTPARKAVEALYALALVLWFASDLWRALGFAGSTRAVAPGPELLGHAGSILLLVAIVVVVFCRGRPRIETWLDAFSFAAALFAPAYLVFIQPALGDATALPWVAGWVAITLTTLCFGGVYVMSGGIWNVPAVLIAVAVSAAVASGVLLHLEDPASVVGTPHYAPAFLVSFFAAIHPQLLAMHARGGRPSGIPLAARVWMLVGALFLPLAALAWCYVHAAPVPVVQVVGPLVLMALVVGIRAALLARAGVRDWSVPLTISLAALSVATVAATLTLRSQSAERIEQGAQALARQASDARQLDGLLLRASRAGGPAAAAADARWRRAVRALEQSPQVPRAELARYVDEGTRLLAAPAPTPRDLARVDAAQTALLTALDAESRHGLTRATERAQAVRSSTVLVLFATLMALATLLLRFNRKRAQLRVLHEQTHDLLTRLPNRVALDREVRSAAAAGGTVVLLDIDDFKSVNDSYGPDSGDAILRRVAGDLRALVPDDHHVARVGGDAFAIVVPAGLDPFDVVHRALSAISRPIDLDGRAHRLHASAGVAEIGADPRRGTAVRDAEVAMYEAKRTEGNSLQAFAPDMHRRVLERIQLAVELREAIDGELGLHLVYQPIVDLTTGGTSGYEALVRWEHPERGFMSPADFIPIAEQSGLIVDLGAWVMRTAAAQMAAWQETWRDGRYVSVNVAAAQLRTGVLEQQVRAALEHSGLPSAHLLLEVTESSLIGDVDAGVAEIERVRALGVRFALDDFGTGYSSLSYLRRFPIDVLKVDKSFVDGLDERDGMLLVRAIIDMAASLRLTVVGEGIEDAGQGGLLRELGCQLGQGFHFSRPLQAVVVPQTDASFAVPGTTALRRFG